MSFTDGGRFGAKFNRNLATVIYIHTYVCAYIVCRIKFSNYTEGAPLKPYLQYPDAGYVRTYIHARVPLSRVNILEAAQRWVY